MVQRRHLKGSRSNELVESYSASDIQTGRSIQRCGWHGTKLLSQTSCDEHQSPETGLTEESREDKFMFQSAMFAPYI